MTEKQTADPSILCDGEHVHPTAIHLIPSNDDLFRLAELLKIFGDPTRVRILYRLASQELCVCDIAEDLAMSQSAISHQLRILKQAHLVKYRREGKAIFYSLSDSHVYTILAQALEHVQE
jgi:ArsR family transcriptional regulator